MVCTVEDSPKEGISRKESWGIFFLMFRDAELQTSLRETFQVKEWCARREQSLSGAWVPHCGCAV